MTSRIQENQLKALFFLILFLVLSIRMLMADTPETRGADPAFYASVGVPSVSVASETSKARQIEVAQTGRPASRSNVCLW